MTPLLLGVAAALAWGVGDYAGALASRRIPAFWTSVGLEVVGTISLVAALAALGAWPAWDEGALSWGFAIGALGVVALWVFYRALAIGPLAVVSPIAGSYTAVTVILVVAFLGERVSTPEGAAIVVTFAGTLLASTDIRRVRAVLGRDVRGVQLAFVAMIGFGVWGAITAAATRAHEPLLLVLIARVVGSALLLAGAGAARVALPRDRRPSTLALVAVVGVLDTAANVLFVQAMATGHAAIAATATGIYPVLLVILGIGLHGERLAPNQYVGIAVLLAGLAALGLLRS